ncbi:MAG: DMT family transporter [Pseudomonadota bacterium]
MPDPTPREVRLALALIWVVPVLWTANYVVARTAPGVIGPYALALGRWLLAGGVLLCFCGRELWQKRAGLRQTWWQYLVLGFLGMLICGAWVYEGARSTSAVNIALIYSASPVLIGMGAAWWLGEHFSMRQAVGVAIAMTGVLHVVLKGQWAALGAVQFVAGDLWIVGATVSWAGFALLQKKWPSDLSATARLAACCAGGVLLLIPCAAWEATQPGLTQWGMQAVTLIVVAGVMPGLGAYGIYGWSQKILGASKVAVALYLGPLYTAAVAWALLGEAPGWHHLVGAALILPGVFLVSGAGFRKAPAKAAPDTAIQP